MTDPDGDVGYELRVISGLNKAKFITFQDGIDKKLIIKPSNGDNGIYRFVAKLSDVKGASNIYKFNIEIRGYSNEKEKASLSIGGTAITVTLEESSIIQTALTSTVVSTKH